MSQNIFEIPVRTSSHTQMIDITRQVQQAVNESGVTDGLCIAVVLRRSHAEFSWKFRIKKSRSDSSLVCAPYNSSCYNQRKCRGGPAFAGRAKFASKFCMKKTQSVFSMLMFRPILWKRSTRSSPGKMATCIWKATPPPTWKPHRKNCKQFFYAEFASKFCAAPSGNRIESSLQKIFPIERSSSMVIRIYITKNTRIADCGWIQAVAAIVNPGSP